MLTLAAGHYHAQLLAHRPALDYLLRRGLDAATIARRRLGYAPVAPAPYDALAFALRHHRLDAGLARRVGLLGPDGRERFAGRLIFPERRADGVVWLSGRAFRDPATGAIDLAGRPKYLGLPLPPGHRKPLLGWSAARGQAVIGVVEGPVDQLILADVLGLPAVGLGGAGVGPAVIARFAAFGQRLPPRWTAIAPAAGRGPPSSPRSGRASPRCSSRATRGRCAATSPSRGGRRWTRARTAPRPGRAPARGGAGRTAGGGDHRPRPAAGPDAAATARRRGGADRASPRRRGVPPGASRDRAGASHRNLTATSPAG